MHRWLEKKKFVIGNSGKTGKIFLNDLLYFSSMSPCVLPSFFRSAVMRFITIVKDQHILYIYIYLFLSFILYYIYTFPDYKIFHRCKINNLINYLMSKSFLIFLLISNEFARSNVRYIRKIETLKIKELSVLLKMKAKFKLWILRYDYWYSTRIFSKCVIYILSFFILNVSIKGHYILLSYGNS